MRENHEYVSKGIEKCKEHSSRQALAFMLGYVGFQVMYFIAYMCAAIIRDMNYIPLVAVAVMLIIHSFFAAVMLMRLRWGGLKSTWIPSPMKILGVAVLVDAILLACTDPVVEAHLSRTLALQGFFVFFGGVPSQDALQLHHPYTSNSVFQCHSLYMGLFVLTFEAAVILLPVGLLFYTSIVMWCYEIDHMRSAAAGHMVISEAARAQEYMDLGMMVVTLTFVISAKFMIQRSQRKLFISMEFQRMETITQKVLRCQAEFENSNLHDQLESSGMRFVSTGRRPLFGPKAAAWAEPREASPRSGSKQSTSARSMPDGGALEAAGPGKPRFMRATSEPGSVQSAPTVVMGYPTLPRKADEQCTGGGGGDCLPADAHVWVEHHPTPMPLGAVTQGHRVLCYDNFCGGLKFTDVLDVKTSDPITMKDTVQVTLEDGTVLDMTTDHPVETFPTEVSRGLREKSRRVQVKDLQKGRDGLMVLKVDNVPVKSVRKNKLDSAATPKPFMSIYLQQPQRHTVFCASGAYTQSMAVGSNDMALSADPEVDSVFYAASAPPPGLGLMRVPPTTFAKSCVEHLSPMRVSSSFNAEPMFLSSMQDALDALDSFDFEDETNDVTAGSRRRTRQRANRAHARVTARVGSEGTATPVREEVDDSMLVCV